MRPKGLSRSRIGCAHLVISAVLSEAVRDKKLAESPCIAIELPGVVIEKDFILPAHAQIEALAAGLPPDWASTIWLMLGCGLRIGEALAVNLRCRIIRGTILRVREQVDPAAQLRPLKFRIEGDFRDIPLPQYVQRRHRQAHRRPRHDPRRLPLPGPQVQASYPPQLPGGLQPVRRQSRAAAAVHPALAAAPLRVYRSGRGHPDHRGLPLARSSQHRGHPPDLRPPRAQLLRPRPHRPRRRLPGQSPGTTAESRSSTLVRTAAW